MKNNIKEILGLLFETVLFVGLLLSVFWGFTILDCFIR